MRPVLRVLHIEDDPNDAELLARKLRSSGSPFSVTLVDQLEEMQRALAEQPWDLILCDHALPGFRSADVLALLKTLDSPPPLVIVSGAIGEEEVVEAFDNGAASYVSKHNLARLVPTIERVLGDAHARRQHRFDQERVELVQAAVNSATDLIFILEIRDGEPTRVLYVNGAERITGYPSAALYAGGLMALRGPDTDPAAIRQLRSAMKRGEAASMELLMYRQDGTTAWVETEVRPLAAGSNRFVAVSRDITERKRLEDQMAFLATHDPLTGLANRALLDVQLERELAQARRTGLGVAVFLIDLDGFKAVNDMLGHAFGDQVLLEVAVRLRGCVRECDTVARLGGDEFVVVMGGVEDLDSVATAARRVLTAIREPFFLDDNQARLSVSIGVAVHPDAGTDPNDLLRNADRAMYEVKAGGKNAFHFSHVPRPLAPLAAH